MNVCACAYTNVELHHFVIGWQTEYTLPDPVLVNEDLGRSNAFKPNQTSSVLGNGFLAHHPRDLDQRLVK